MPRRVSATRRQLLRAGGVAGLTAFGGAIASADNRPAKKKGGDEKEKEADIGPGEDLMREHGVLRRILLVYDELARRLENHAAFDVTALQKSARLVRTFVEDYHERQEEEMLFPRFEQAGKLVELTRVLRAQHQAGRTVTQRITALATPATLKDPTRAGQLRDELGAFARMYRPHAAREDTVLFPALHELVSASAYDALGEDFERREHQTFGKDGFADAVAQIEAIEKTLGIDDLAQFTPKV